MVRLQQSIVASVSIVLSQLRKISFHLYYAYAIAAVMLNIMLMLKPLTEDHHLSRRPTNNASLTTTGLR